MCELVHLCKIIDCQGTCLTIDSFNVVPSQAKLGAKLVGTADFSVEQQTGTGMTRLDLYMPDGSVNQDDELETGFAPGNYSLGIELDTSESQGFMPGTYTLQLWFCEGECGSHHPHSKIYDVRNATFTLTK